MSGLGKSETRGKMYCHVIIVACQVLKDPHIDQKQQHKNTWKDVSAIASSAAAACARIPPRCLEGSDVEATMRHDDTTRPDKEYAAAALPVHMPDGKTQQPPHAERYDEDMRSMQAPAAR